MYNILVNQIKTTFKLTFKNKKRILLQVANEKDISTCRKYEIIPKKHAVLRTLKGRYTQLFLQHMLQVIN